MNILFETWICQDSLGPFALFMFSLFMVKGEVT